MKISKIFNVPIQSKEQCEKYNAKFGTNYISSEEHLDNVVNELYNMIEQVGNSGGWYTSDSIKLEIKVMYCPEDK